MRSQVRFVPVFTPGCLHETEARLLAGTLNAALAGGYARAQQSSVSNQRVTQEGYSTGTVDRRWNPRTAAAARTEATRRSGLSPRWSASKIDLQSGGAPHDSVLPAFEALTAAVPNQPTFPLAKRNVPDWKSSCADVAIIESGSQTRWYIRRVRPGLMRALAHARRADPETERR